MLQETRDKPNIRERALFDGVAGLSDVELLAIVIGTGAGGQSVTMLAASLLEESGGLEAMLRLGPNAISSWRGVGPAKAARVAAAFELGRRAAFRIIAERRNVIGHLDAVIAWARPRLVMLDHEEVWLLMLDGRNGLKSARRIAQGGLHGCALTPRDVLVPALRDAATSILLVHNHPSGDPEPSPEDFQMTRAVGAACDILGIPLLDHVVVARRGARSLFELGAFD